MTVCIQKRDRCRICFSLILRDRSTLFSSICCQKYYHLFKHIKRTKIPNKKYNPYKIKISNQTVCFRDLILRYLHRNIQPIKNFSNFICYDCSMILLDIEQCAKYLTKTINQLKTKFFKSNRLITSSLSTKKNFLIKSNKNSQLTISNSDEDEEFDDSLSNNLPINSINRNKCNDDEDDDDEDDDNLIINSTLKSQQIKSPEILRENILPNLNSSSMNLLDETNPNILQLRLAHMMANAAGISSSSTGQNNNNNNVDLMNTLANIQRNFLLKILNDPTAAAQAAQAAAAAVSATQNKTNISPISLITSNNNKQIGSSRKRKSTPEKRVITNHRSTNNNDDTSSTTEHESIDNINNQDSIDHPLELTLKSLQRSNRVSSSTDIQNLVINSKTENGSLSNIGQFYQHIDEDHKESTTPNDSSLSLSPSLNRRSTSTKRQRLSTSGQFDYTNTHNNLSMINLPQTTTDLLSPNHHQTTTTTINDDNNNSNIHQRQQRKLDPRPCAECGKILFSDKTHLLHCQTHAKNEKQCWICGINDDDIKKHITNEHGNQKFTNTGFKCQHCDKVFPVFADLETHTKDHSKKKPFECPICNKRFGQQGNLSCHLRIHSGVKPFTCTSCGKAFRHSNSLRRHARTVHSVSRGLTSTNSLLLPNTTTSLSNDIKSETFDDVPSALMIPSDDGSLSTGDIPSPSISNAHVDSDSHEQFGNN